MYATAILVFREVLEAALVISLVAAATKGLPHRGKWIGAGLFLGIAGAVLLSLMADVITQAAEGLGQELLNAIILFTAVIMLGWHNIWMKKHSRELTSYLKGVGENISSGETPLHVLAVVIGLAVLREGAELVLFLYGVSAMGTQISQMVLGSFMGLAAGTAVGGILYFGLTHIPTRLIFSVTSIMLLLLSAGLAAQGAALLVQADVLPAYGYAVWDTSWLLDDRSVVGNIFHVLIGYTSAPMGIQVLFYVSTLLIIGGMMFFINRNNASKTGLKVSATTAVLLVVTLMTASPDAKAGLFIYSPHVEYGEAELEFKTETTFDSDASKDGADKHVIEAGYGIQEHWFSSIFGEYKKNPGQDLEYEATAWENIFQLSEQGEHWMDYGLYFEYEVANSDADSDKVEMGLLLEKQAENMTHTANIFLERHVGSGAASEVEMSYGWRTRWNISPEFEPAIELYGALGEVGNFNSTSDQDHRLGPVLAGQLAKTKNGKFRYELGYLFGLTSASPDGTLKAMLEYEFRF